MKKHIIAYVDEQASALDRFQARVSETLEVMAFLPKPNLENFVEELLNSNAEAFVVDFKLNEFRDDVEGPINYDGAELIEKILEIRQGFPCFILTSFDATAVQEIDEVNCVYPKETLDPEKQTGQITFPEKVRIQIEHYQAKLNERNERFHELLNKSEKNELTEEEENELLNLDSFLEKVLNNREAIPAEKKDSVAFGRIDTLIKSTDELIEMLKKEG